MISRRRALQMAGGITFLALTSEGRVTAVPGRRGAAPRNPLQPVFKAMPYLQPGADGGPLRDGAESLVIAWETNRVPADFTVEWGIGNRLTERAEPKRTERYNVSGQDGKSAYHYAAALSRLRLDTRYQYRVRLGGRTIVEGNFRTRKKRGTPCRFVAFGDNSLGDVHERMITFQAHRARPDFLVNTGDTVYEDGLANEYTRYFFPVFNADAASPTVGAPLLRSVPFYTVLGNHDHNGSDSQGIPGADFDREPDALGYFQCLHLPQNGPADLTHPIAIYGKEEQLAIFRAAAGERYPRMGNYSFDYGDAHFLCLDSNTYVDPTDARLQEWIRRDLAQTDAVWKIVIYHHPAFNIGAKHYSEQQMRVLSPLLEQAGVALVLNGHEHIYQRTRPLRFAPTDISRAAAIGDGDRLVPGKFTIDRTFDGEKNTRPDGVLYITTGTGGKYLYNETFNNAPEKWRHPQDDNADYVVRLISDRHSLTVIDMDAKTLTLTQIDQWGDEIDRCRLSRA